MNGKRLLLILFCSFVMVFSSVATCFALNRSTPRISLHSTPSTILTSRVIFINIYPRNIRRIVSVKIRGVRPISEAIITRGGVDVKEISPKTMESKLISGLYFAGEVLDLDAYTGGFNLQIAFSTAYAAARALATVDFPAPPLPEAIVMICPIGTSYTKECTTI